MKTTLAVTMVALVLAACSTTPTGRRQLQLFPDDQVAQMGSAAFAQTRQKQPVVQDRPVNQYVECVTNALIAVVPAPPGSAQWKVTVFQSDEANAFALPSGDIGVYMGLLKAARTPAQLAAVIGHEIAHVQARHSNARLSTQFATEAGLGLIASLQSERDIQSRTAMALLGLGTQVGILLPFSRSQESEADVLGQRYMTDAGFDPRDSVSLWENMSKLGGAKPPAFLSTHPSGKKRIEDLQKNMPQMLEQYRRAQASGRKPNCTPANG